MRKKMGQTDGQRERGREGERYVYYKQDETKKEEKRYRESSAQSKRDGERGTQTDRQIARQTLRGRDRNTNMD